MIDVFVDSSFLKAFIDENDDFHKQAIKIFEILKSRSDSLITSNYILDETFTLVRNKCGLERVKQLVDALDEFDIGLKIIRVLIEDENNAWDWFWKDWSKLSFTDCVSFSVMKRLNINKVATFDAHFSRAGFEVEK